MTAVLDCRGLRCPQPVVQLARQLRELAVGELLTVLTDDPVAAVDIPAWCWLRKQEYLGMSDHDGGGAAHQVRRAT